MGKRALQIVDALLETSAGYGSGVYVFGPTIDESGRAFTDQATAIQSLGGNPEALIEHGYSFFVKKSPGDVLVISKTLPIRTSSEGEKRAVAFLGLDKHHSVAYRPTFEGTTTKSINAGALLAASRTVSTQEMLDLWDEMSKWDLMEAPMAQSPFAGGQPAGTSLGITYDKGQSKNGVYVSAIHPNGAAARSGIQAADRIVGVAKHASKGGEQIGPFRISNANDLSSVLSQAESKYPIVFFVQRGPNQVRIPVKF